MAAVRKGYINAARTRVRKYPFNLLTPGDYLEPYPWDERDRVRYAMLKWNAEQGVRLTISRYPNGSPENTDPHIIVGWPVGEEGKPRKPGVTSSWTAQGAKKRRPGASA